MPIRPVDIGAIGQGGVVVPGAPGTLSLDNGSTSGTMIDLSWSAPSDNGGGTISGYKIQRSTNSGSSWSDLVSNTGSTATTYTNSGLTRLTRYDYRVAGINEKGAGAYGNAPNHTTTAELPDAPGTLSLANGSNSKTQINLSWSAPADNGGASVTGYRIKQGGSVIVANTSSTGTTYTVSGLSANTAYNFNVAAITSFGTGADGNTPSHTTAGNIAYSTTGSPTITTYGSYRSFKYTGSGTFVITANSASEAFDVFTVGGGGGSGGHQLGVNGGAGGGGTRTTNLPGTVKSYTATVGSGGSNAGSFGNPGQTTEFTDVSDTGPGKHANTGFSSDANGGSQGGSYGYYFYGCCSSSPQHDAGGLGNTGGEGVCDTAGSGYGYAGGGGGGRGSSGGSATENIVISAGSTLAGGTSGNGTYNNYETGSNIGYAGGGGGASNYYLPQGNGTITAASNSYGGGTGYYKNTAGTSITATYGDTNSGGGGGGNNGGGGSGVVIVRIPWG